MDTNMISPRGNGNEDHEIIKLVHIIITDGLLLLEMKMKDEDDHKMVEMKLAVTRVS